MNNYPYFTAQNYRYPSVEQPIGLKGRPVSSIDEVRATSIDFDGSIFYFPDLANKRIYTKQINVDGTSTINIYELKPIPVETQPQYVTREEFETALKKLSEQAGMQSQSAPQTAKPADKQYNF